MSAVFPATRATGALEGTPAIMDIEASGFGRASYPIEVGFILGDGTSFCTLVRPAPSWTHWDPHAESVHHITRATVERHGRPVAEVASLLNDRLRGQTLYSDGWAHDYPWLAVLFDEAGCVPAFRLDSLRKLLSEDQASRWQHTRERLGDELSVARHRASTDAWLLQETWLRVQQPDPV